MNPFLSQYVGPLTTILKFVQKMCLFLVGYIYPYRGARTTARHLFYLLGAHRTKFGTFASDA
jgi:hypothetical protein